MRRAMATVDLAVLDDPDAPRIRRAPIPAGGRRRCRRTDGRAGRHRGRLRRPPVTRRISLALAIHNHQPVGNFGWVFAETYDQAYLPMLEALERHPGVRLSLHYTGPAPGVVPGGTTGLRRSPEGPRRRGTRSRSWVAATTNPSWRRSRSATGSASSPGWATSSSRCSGGGPGGAWLAERVWEPDLPASLAEGGYELDDPRRRPLPGRGHPRGGPLGAVHDRGPGRDPDRLRHRAGSPLPDPVPRRRGRHRLPPRPRDRGRIAASG